MIRCTQDRLAMFSG